MHGHCHSHPAEHGSCGCGSGHHESSGPGARAWDATAHHHWPGGDEFAGGFGVRRPLRFLAWKLGLSEPQVAQFAAIINELKTERAQAAVDDRRALTLLADAAQAEVFDEARAGEALKLRTSSEERVQKKVLESLGRMHALLDAEQRARLAYLLRTGVLAM